jgi:hypothetical protein
MFLCSHTIFRELIIRACLSYTLLKWSVMVHQCTTIFATITCALVGE